MPAPVRLSLAGAAQPPHTRWSRLAILVTGVLLGVVLGVLAPPVLSPSARPLAVLTPLQQTQYQLLHELAQAPTVDARWIILAQMEKTMHTLHPQPRAHVEVLLPGMCTPPLASAQKGRP